MSKKDIRNRRQSQQMVQDLKKYFESEAANEGPLRNVNQVQKRVSEALKVSVRTIMRVRRHVEECLENAEEISSPTLKRSKFSAATKNLDNFTVEAIRSVIYEMYASKQHITLKRLQKVLQDRDIYNFSIESLRISLKFIGFNHENHFIEQDYIREWRVRFLREYKIASMKYDVVFLAETWISAKGGIQKSWEDSNSIDAKHKSTNNSRYIILNAGNKNGFIRGCSLIFPAAKNTLDGEMDATKFEYWLENALLPNLTTPSLIIFDNASCHNRIKNLAPNESWKRRDLEDYLNKLEVEVDSNLLKIELLHLAKQHPPKNEYVVDGIITARGHRVLRLPPFHSHYNAIDLVWYQCKSYFDAHMGTDGFGHIKVLEIWQKALDLVTSDNWSSYIRHTEKIIKESWDREVKLDDVVIQQSRINYGGSDSESGSDSN